MSHQSKFFPLLRTLSPEELLGFQKFLNKYHGGEAGTLKVYAYCKRFHDPKMDVDKIDLAGIYRKLFNAEMGSQQRDRKKMLNPLSDLYLWLKEFLLAEKMRSESWISKMVWLEIFQERGLHREYSQLASDLYKEQAQKLLPDDFTCLQKMGTGMHFKRHLIQEKGSPDYQSLAECAQSVQQSADILSIKMACEIVNDQRIRPKEIRSAQNPAEQPLMLLYQMLFSLLNNGKEEDFSKIVSYLDEYLEIISENEALTIVRLLHNFAAPIVRSARATVWKKRLHELDKILLKKELFTQKGVMSPTSFCNIVNIACGAQEIQWAKDFIKGKQHLLAEETRSESIKLANAIIAFEEKKFAEVLVLVKDPQIKSIQHVIRSKALHLRALYELNPQDDAIEDLYVSLKIYLKRNRKEQPNFVDATQSFLELFNKLYREKVTKQALIQEIETTPNLYFYPWLLDKAATYKGRNARQKPKGK